MSDDLRAELDRLEALWADKTDAESRNDSDALYLATWKAEAEVVNAFPALAAELRRLWGVVHDCPACGAACVNCRCVYDELDRLRAEVAALHAQLQAQAYVVPEGSQLVVPPHVESVGYVLVRGGHVAVQEVTP